jgi:hypothetical protein
MRIILFQLIFLCSSGISAQSNFDSYFSDRTLRIDFMLAGNSEKTVVYPLGMKQEPFWAGSVNNLIDPFQWGNFKYEVFDETGNRLIYSKGYCSLFQEWQTTPEARSAERCFYEVATIPFPRNSIRFVLSMRDRKNNFVKLYETRIDPSDYFIRKENPVKATSTKIYGKGDPHVSIDIAFISEGYKADEMDKFRDDVRRMADALLAEPPFCDHRNKFNVWAVEAVSQESGTDIPGEEIYVNTALNSSFYTFNLDRYLTTTDLKAVNDYAAVVPHDNIVVLINSSRYGGGGLYNYYCGTTAGNDLSQLVFIHEFGHCFAGLADEYYSSSVAYDQFYPLDTEPWEPNITTLVNFETKWKKLIGKNTPVPTPAEEKYKNVTGVFEGGGYMAKGIYRPEMECRMRTNGAKGFCAVCRDAITLMILYYTK